MLAYVNGEFVPEEEASVSVRDRGFMLGDGVFDVWRTYGGKTVRGIVERNLERLRKGMNYIELPGDELIKRVDEVTTELTARNSEAIHAAGDVWIFTYVTRGAGIEGFQSSEPTIACFCTVIPFDEACPLEWYESGVRLTSSMQVRNPFTPVDPRVKSTSRLAYVRAQLKAARVGAGTWVTLFDDDGYITEAVAAALCLVEGDTIVQAPRHKMLPSINLQVFCELGVKLGYAHEERPLTLYDYINADEVYVLSTPFGAYPVVDIDGIPVKRGNRVGPKIMDAWVDYVEYDFTKQLHSAGAVT
jgi:branched-subunit amino acid aminotransferase/4-amino-4-deoxychorismate lyase